MEVYLAGGRFPAVSQSYIFPTSVFSFAGERSQNMILQKNLKYRAQIVVSTDFVLLFRSHYILCLIFQVGFIFYIMMQNVNDDDAIMKFAFKGGLELKYSKLITLPMKTQDKNSSYVIIIIIIIITIVHE